MRQNMIGAEQYIVDLQAYLAGAMPWYMPHQHAIIEQVAIVQYGFDIHRA